jgi:hypothetical protein
MYDLSVSLVLIGMIVTGATRSVAVKLFYQLGVESPYFATILYLMGQSLSLIVYLISVKYKKYTPVIDEGQEYLECEEYEMDAYIRTPREQESEQNECDPKFMRSNSVRRESVFEVSDTFEGSSEQSETDPETESEDLAPPAPPIIPHPRASFVRQGSETGLTEESRKAVNWIHSIPWYLKPAIPGFCNLCNSAMRWGSLIYISASVAEILISGLELVLSVFAGRIIRKRLVSYNRWIGVGIVSFGLVLVGTLHSVGSSSGNNSDMSDKLIGMLLIVGQCIMSVAQDIAEEVFMDEAGYPATLLLGMEGLFGLVFGLLLYMIFGGDDASSTWDMLISSRFTTVYAIFLPFLFTLTGILNIMATGATSSMTRNVWKNLRTVLVWGFSLTIYYCTPDEALGEPWVMPDSLYILCGFAIMLSGIYVYYKNQEHIKHRCFMCS